MDRQQVMCLFACAHVAEREMSLRLWQKLSRLIEFPRRVLIELEEIRRAQTRLENNLLEEIRRAQTRLENNLESLKTHLNSTLEETSARNFDSACYPPRKLERGSS